MGMVQRNRWFSAVGAAAIGAFAFASAASAEISTDKSGSIVIFPKVVWDGNQDTIIQITNTSNVPAYAHCFYVNASEPGLCQETDFDLFLTKQQPTQWVVSTGRRVNFLDGFNNPGAGLDPGLIPPVPPGFKGELKCIQVNDDGSPLRANSLKGEATLISASGDASKYNAIALEGNPFPAGDTDGPNELVLNRAGSGAEQTGEYDACPNALLVNHWRQNVLDPFVGNTIVNTSLTLVPCSENLETGEPGVVTVQFEIFDEFERELSGSTTVRCFVDAPLEQLSPAFGLIETPAAFTRIIPVPGHGGVIGVAQETRFSVDDPLPTTTLSNLTTEGNRFSSATDTDGNPIQGVVDRVVVPQN